MGLSIDKIRGLVAATRLVEGCAIIIKDLPTGGQLAELHHVEGCTDYVYSTDSRFLGKVVMWLADNASPYM